MKKGIIFDMDGTLWDSAAQVAESWNVVLEKEYPEVLVRITKEDMYRVMGKTMDVIADILFPAEEKEKRGKILADCGKYEIQYLKEHGGMLYPKVEETFKKLKEEYDLYIVSNCQKGYIEAFLDYYHLESYIKDTECYGNTNLKKGDNIKLLAERNQLEEAVYVGDIEGDYLASKEAGIKFIHAAYGFGTIADKVPEIAAFSELPEVVKTVL